MQAISHVATALILKRQFPGAPMLGLIAGTEAIEFLWVGFNIAGIERTEIGPDQMQSIADVHLVHMPFSHSVGVSLVVATLTYAILRWRGLGAIAPAIGLAILSHIVLDLLVHAHDIAWFPGLSPHLGTGLYSDLPLGAFIVEALWTLICWIGFSGSWKLLGLMMAFQLASLPFYSTALNTGEAMLLGQETLFTFVILAQTLITSAVMWWATRDTRSKEQTPPAS